MTRWEQVADYMLEDPDMGDFLSSADLKRVVELAHHAADSDLEVTEKVSQATLERRQAGWVAKAIGERRLAKIQRGLYANWSGAHEANHNEVAVILRRTAVVSLHTVLGESGVLHNPSRIVFSVIRGGTSDASRPRDEATGIAQYRFISMRGAAYGAGADGDRLDPAYPYPRATPERAFCDWIYIGQSAPHRTRHYPPLDLDMEELDRDRIHRLAAAMGIEAGLATWLERKRIADADVDFSEKVSTRLGI